MQVLQGTEAEDSAEYTVCKRDFFPRKFPQFMFNLKFSFFAIGKKGHNLQTHVSFLAVRFKAAEKILSRQQPVCQKENSTSSRRNSDLPIRGTGADFHFSIFIKKSNLSPVAHAIFRQKSKGSSFRQIAECHQQIMFPGRIPVECTKLS